MFRNLEKNVVGRFFGSSSHKNSLIGSQTVSCHMFADYNLPTLRYAQVQIQSGVRVGSHIRIAIKRHWSSTMITIQAGCQWIGHRGNTVSYCHSV